MKNEDRVKLLKAIVEKNGHWPQIEMLQEELGEFLQAINKLKRTKECDKEIDYPTPLHNKNYSLRYFDVCSEIADLEILTEQMRNIFCSEAIDLAKNRKLERQLKRYNTNTM